MVLALWDKRLLHLRSWWYPSPKFNKLTAARYFITSPPTERGQNHATFRQNESASLEVHSSPIPRIRGGTAALHQRRVAAHRTVNNLASNASIQVSDNPPSAPVKGMVRYAVSPWDPLGNGFSGLVVYSANAWVQV